MSERADLGAHSASGKRHKMDKTRDLVNPPSAETIARMADRGENIMRFFGGQGRMIRRVGTQPRIRPRRPNPRNEES